MMLNSRFRILDLKNGLLDQVVGNSVDIPRHTHGINQTHAHQNPPGGIREHEEKREHVSEMEETAKNTNRIPFGILQNFHFFFLLSNRARIFLKSNAKTMLRSPGWEDWLNRPKASGAVARNSPP
jgi:hypothetical protein